MKGDIELSKVFRDSDGVDLTPTDRLTFAKQILLWLGFICVGVFVAHGLYPANAAISEIFELIKIGALPLVTLVVSFYFPNSSK
jgi:hypothetical protein